MKTKELIAMLREIDPAGEEQCCIDNADIWDIGVEPAYYDGSLHVIDFDEHRRPIRGRRVRSGRKIVQGLSPLLFPAVMSEQEMVDALNARKEPHYQRHDSKQPDPCGHWNCTYHGLCILAEFRNICGSDEAVLEYISHSKPVSRESVCHCGHRCASVFWNNKHTTYMCQPGCDCVKNS